MAKLSENNPPNKYPIGRMKWRLKESACGVNHSEHSLAISLCNFPLEYTCDSGECIDIKKRCDGKKDCNDGSDELICSLTSIPSLYDNAAAPEPKGNDRVMSIHIDTRVIRIDSIDTINMVVVLTIDISLTWNDGRLLFFNPTFDQDNIISDHKSSQLWTPMRILIHENAITGDVSYDGREIKIHPKVPEPLDVSRAMENVVYNGSYNPLELVQRMKIKYDCGFHVTKFPFDDQNCSFIMKINHQRMTSIQFVSTRTTVYEGQRIVDQFSIGEICSSTNNTGKSARYTINIHMIRNFTNQLLNIFIPTLILWLFGYSTLFIDVADFSDRFIGAGTSLLVIATLFDAISKDLPKTSYMKLIDLWFLWHNFTILAIIFCHIILNRLHVYLENREKNEVMLFERIRWMPSIRLDGMKTMRQMNDIVIMMFPIFNGLFYSLYFHFTLN